MKVDPPDWAIALFWLIILGFMVILGNEIMGRVNTSARKAVKRV
jgi:hypothetical protein